MVLALIVKVQIAWVLYLKITVAFVPPPSRY